MNDTIIKWDFFMKRKDREHCVALKHNIQENTGMVLIWMATLKHFKFMLIICLAVVTCIGMLWAFSYKTYKADFLRKCFTE